MKNRIRHYRRQRNLTLKALADTVGTTPQTVSRLETEVMTLSTDWLERLGRALGVHASELLDTPERPDIPVLGFLGADGSLGRASDGERLIFDIRAERPVAVRIAQGYGPYRAGEILVGSRLDGADMENGLGRDCLCCLADGHLLLRRVIRGTGTSHTLVPLSPDGDVRYNQDLLWLARLLLRLEYI
jgi:transcriptional regulator with XRE-family HTH domain